MSDYRPTPKRLIVGPVKAYAGMLHDSEGNHICDIRGWGRIQYFENAEQIQDGLADWVAEAITERLKTHPI